MPTPNENYWNNFAINDTDVEHLYGFMLERGEPVPTGELLNQVIAARIREEEERRSRYNEQSTIYQPKSEFQIGQRLIFPSLQDAQGVVTAIRPADNPRLPSFQVIAVQFPDGQITREFAAGYSEAHSLNQDIQVAAGTANMTPQEIAAEYGNAIQEELRARLRSDKEFVELDGRWLLRGLLTGVHEGFLNVAEAAIEQANTSMTTQELAQVLELGGPKKSTIIFSLEHALRHDPRFEDVGPRGEARWYLQRLIPPEAREIPRILRLHVPAQPRAPLPQELETVVMELGDTADVNTAFAVRETPNVPIITVELTYPHRRYGTLPLTPSVRSLFPETDNPRMLLILIDEFSGKRIPVWFVREGNYLTGLKAYYDQGKLNPGAHIQLHRRPEALSATVGYVPQRERSLWVRVARVHGGQLTFAQEKRPVAHKYDEEMLIMTGDATGIDGLQQSTIPDRPLEELLALVFPELAKLSGGGRVHAKTLFSAVNFLLRVGPRAVFGALVQSPSLSSAGGGYFVIETARDFAR